jgi:serine protease Do
MRKKVTYALIAAGVGAGIATGYSHFDTRALGSAQAATAPSAVLAPAVAGTAAANLPDFTALVDRAGPSVVNISVVGTAKKGMQGAPDEEDDDEGAAPPDLLKRFGIPNGPGGQGARPQQQTRPRSSAATSAPTSR